MRRPDRTVELWKLPVWCRGLAKKLDGGLVTMARNRRSATLMELPAEPTSWIPGIPHVEEGEAVCRPDGELEEYVAFSATGKVGTVQEH